ncbi:glycosyltransferase family 90 protein [Xylaria nigripes]|nr:glycosyltransferase family 90 protein [Xylaria nigripes]
MTTAVYTGSPSRTELYLYAYVPQQFLACVSTSKATTGRTLSLLTLQFSNRRAVFIMRLLAFPPRRPYHLIRSIFLSTLLIGVLYYLLRGSATPHRNSTVRDPTSAADQAADQRPLKPPSSGQSYNKLTRPDGVNDKAEKDDEYDWNEESGRDGNKLKEEQPFSGNQPRHPIDDLIRAAEKKFRHVRAKESTTLSQAAEAYRERRGRHPPPGFDTWFNFAREKNAIIVEDYFDRIYHDLNPFWALDPKVIRKEAWDFEMTINIRNHKATAGSDWFWTQIWLEMFRTIEHLLPDMDVALNAMDEPRLVVPWEEVATYMKQAERTRKLIPVDEVISTFKRLPAPGTGTDEPETRPKRWESTGPFWLLARRGCPPDSPARRADVVHSYDKPVFSPEWASPHQYQGYVSNYSLSTDFCHQPDLQGLEGIFISPLSTSSSRVLYPLFGGSKLATNNEILLPAPMYWNEEDRFTGRGDAGPAWEDKIGLAIWRGVATGGRNREFTWQGFQRHRFVAMNNWTKLSLAEAELVPPVNFELPAANYDVMASNKKQLGEWVSEWADVRFTDLMCDPEFESEGGQTCYTNEHFETALGLDLTTQFGFKYLPDIDGNSFSGRYLGFLRSTGLPIKSTMWQEWHDSRLIAWKHFVPMDNRFGDYYGIMEYFLGYGKSRPGHDDAAKKIAMDGKAWAERVLRKEDMQIYVLRLLLEYARVSDDRREKMGWAEDLQS